MNTRIVSPNFIISYSRPSKKLSGDTNWRPLPDKDRLSCAWPWQEKDQHGKEVLKFCKHNSPHHINTPSWQRQIRRAYFAAIANATTYLHHKSGLAVPKSKMFSQQHSKLQCKKKKSGFEQVQRQKKRYRSQGSCKNEGHEGQTEVDKSNRQVQKSHTVQTMSLFRVICMQEEFTPKVANNHTEWAQSHQTMCPAQAQDYHCAYQEQRQLLKPAKHYKHWPSQHDARNEAHHNKPHATYPHTNASLQLLIRKPTWWQMCGWRSRTPIFNICPLYFWASGCTTRAPTASNTSATTGKHAVTQVAPSHSCQQITSEKNLSRKVQTGNITKAEGGADRRFRNRTSSVISTVKSQWAERSTWTRTAQERSYCEWVWPR